MKRYEKPEIKLEKLVVEDVITVSSEIPEPTTPPVTPTKPNETPFG